MSFFEELKRRNVVRVAIAYVLLGWAVLQGADFLLDLAGAPEWVMRVFAVAGLVGFPFALFFAWAYELTPEGIKPEREVDCDASITPRTGRKLDRLIILFLVAAAAEPAPAAEDEHSDRRSVAVLPFIALSSGADEEYFADGLTEKILNSLAQLPELLVTARTSAFQFKGQDLPVQEIAGQLGVRHVVEGSVRRSGDRLRVTAQLIRAADGFHLWLETYDSTSQDTIEVQEDIAEQIATALDVVLDERRREAMRRAGLRDVEAFIALQKAYERYDAAHGEVDQVGGLLEANRYFEQVLERVPNYAPALVEHADAYVHMLDYAAWGDATPGTGQPTVDSLAQAVSDRAFSQSRAVFAEIVFAAARGERARAGELRQAFLERAEATDFEALQIHAMVGDRQEANVTAARVDQRARIPMSLMLATLWCHCGAPFDLEAMPTFAAKLQEGDLPWPPPSPIAFPLKDW